MSSSRSLSALFPARTGMRLFAGSLLLAASAATMLPAFAQGHHGGHGPGHAMMSPGGAGPMGGSPRHMERMLDRVAATDAQKAQIKQITEASRADMLKQREAGRALHDKLRLALTAATIDTNAVEQLRLQMLAQHDQTSRRGLQTMVDIAQVLTPEQRAKAGELMAQAATKRQERMQRYQRDGAAPKS
jgi:periplasmic protein CpxP/Spy